MKGHLSTQEKLLEMIGRMERMKGRAAVEAEKHKGEEYLRERWFSRSITYEECIEMVNEYFPHLNKK